MPRPAARLSSPPRSGPAWAAITLACALFTACLAAWAAGGGAVRVPWAPSLGLDLTFELDGLAALYSLLAAGVGVAVFAYGAAYLPLHLQHEDRPLTESRRFWLWMVLFLGAMVGLALVQDLVALFVLFDVTALCSYFLIGFDRAAPQARRAAFTALLLTAGSAIGLLLAAVILHAELGTFAIPALLAHAGDGGVPAAATVLIAVAALAKSAQVPLHFWLPAAMAAPTPVSAYLHSAAMVAAGVLVLGRLHPLLAAVPPVLDGLMVVGGASMVVGGLLALAADRLKQILAYSTIAQYGYVVLMYGVGGHSAAGGAALYVLAHALAKSTLFMAAGAVTMATGEDRLGRLGGLLARMPLTGAASAVAAATLGALPLTIGFFKDELFFKAVLEGPAILPVLAVGGAALTVAYIGRFWIGVFLGPARARVEAVPVLLAAPPVLLAVVMLAGGVVVEPFAALASAAGTATAGAPVEVSPAYHLDARAENLMALAAWTLGAAMLGARRAWAPAVAALARAGRRFGPRRAYQTMLAGLTRLSQALHDIEVRGLRSSVAAVLAPGGILTTAALLQAPALDAYRVGAFSTSDLLVVAVFALVVVAALGVAWAHHYLRMVLAVAVLGFALAAVYGMVGAPDVALVAVVVETILTLVFLSVLARLPRLLLPRDEPPSRRWRDTAVGAIAGIGAFIAIWRYLSQTTAERGVASRLIDLAPSAHGDDVVTAILADFRGLDTLAEITVLGVALAGVATLLRRERDW